MRERLRGESKDCRAEGRRPAGVEAVPRRAIIQGEERPASALVRAACNKVGEGGLAPSPPPEPDWRISRIRLSSWQFRLFIEIGTPLDEPVSGSKVPSR